MIRHNIDKQPFSGVKIMVYKNLRISIDYLLILLFLILSNIYYFAPVFKFYPVHDTMNWLVHYFYIFYNEYAINGEFPLWLPYYLSGMHSDYFILSVISPAQYFAAFAGKLLGIENALLLLKLSMFLEQLAFVTGLYLLSMRLFKHRLSVLFVCIGGIFTIFWGSNYGFSFRFYYMVPFILFFIIKFIDTSRITNIWLTGIFTIASLLGNAIYYVPIYLFIFSLFFLILFFTARKRPKVGLKDLFSLSSVCFLIIFIILGFVFYDFVRHTLDATTIFSTERTSRGRVTHDNFLHHGGLFTEDNKPIPGSGLDFIWQLLYANPRTYDFTVYIGLIAVVFIIYSLLSVRGNPRFKAVSYTTVCLLALSLGEISFVASALYLFFPMMDIYRHISYLPSLAKVFLLFMAGFGVDRYLKKQINEHWLKSPAFIGAVLAAVILFIDIFVFKGDYGYQRTNGDIINYRFHFVPLFTLAFMCLYLVLHSEGKEKAVRMIVILYLLEMASFYTAFFIGMPIKEPSPFAKNSFIVKRYNSQNERYERETMYRMRPDMQSAMDYANINKIPLQFSAFYVDPCIKTILEDMVRIDNVNANLSHLLNVRFESEANSNVLSYPISKDFMNSLRNDKGFLRAVGCNEPKFYITESPKFALDRDLAFKMVRDSDNLYESPVIHPFAGTNKVDTAKLDGRSISKFGKKKLLKTMPTTLLHGWLHIRFEQKLGNAIYPFWETMKGLPYFLGFQLQRNNFLTEYSLIADLEPYIADRMPIAWALQGSIDGGKWVDIDRREGERNWRPNEERIYNVKMSGAYRYYRFQIIRLNNYSDLMRIGSIKVKFRKPVEAGSLNFISKNLGLKAEAKAIEKSEQTSKSGRSRILSAAIVSNSASVIVESESENAWLVYLDNFHPAWKATLNNKPAEILKANIAFKALKLDKGRNEIKFVFTGNYRSSLYGKGFFLFGVVTCLYLLTLVILCVFGSQDTSIPSISLFFLLAFLAAFPIFAIEFGLHNDYSILSFDKPSDLSFTKILFAFKDENPHLIMVGRPINAFIMGVLTVMLDSISQLAPIRFISFFLTVLCGLLMYYYLTRRLALSQLWAIAISFGIFALPSSQQSIIWVTNFAPGPLTVFLASLSYLVFDASFEIKDWGLRKMIYIIISFVLLITAFLIYQPNALFFMVFTAARIFFTKLDFWPQTRLRIFKDIIFSAFTAIFYFLFTKVVLVPVALKIFPHMQGLFIEPQRYALSITTDLVKKIIQFYDMSMIAFSIWFHSQFDERIAYPILLVFTIVLTTLLFLHLRYMNQYKNKVQAQKDLRWIQQICISILIIILISNMPILIAKGSFTSYRLIFSYCAIVVIMMFWSIRSFIRVIFKNQTSLFYATSAICVITLLLSLSLAASNLYSSALSANRELNFFRQKLINEMPFNTVNVYIIKPPWGSSYVEPVIKHEFNYMATNYNDTPLPNVIIRNEMKWSRMPGIVHLGKRYLMNDLYKDPYKIFYMDNSFKVMELDETKFLINMNEIANSRVMRYTPLFIKTSY